MVITTSNIVELVFGHCGATAHYLNFPFNSAGMALVSDETPSGENIFDKPHHLLVHQTSDCFLISRPGLHLLTSHKGNVSHRGPRLEHSRAERQRVDFAEIQRDSGFSQGGLDRIAAALRA